MVIKWYYILLFLYVCDEVHPGKDKEKITRKRPTAVNDPYGMRSLDDWVDLGSVVLKKSCEAVNLSPSGGIMAMARRLEEFYHQMAEGAGRGKRVYFYLFRGLTWCMRLDNCIGLSRYLCIYPISVIYL